ncbi:MAG: hypothetical protein Ta2F_00890 [Termitinemataceae bacterium]|nr:MAG: hypothetical protein Ta2F_00890 [Termitinemataceae bacterium]
MQDFLSNEPYLQRFSTDELVALAERLGIELSLDKDRLFIIDELLEYAPCLNIYQEENPFDAADFKNIGLHTSDSTADTANVPEEIEVAKLPEQYNITYIEVLVRDPLWVFVYWEIRASVKQEIEKTANFNSYILRVKLFECTMGSKCQNLFSIPVTVSDNSLYVNFPPDGPCQAICKTRQDAVFQVELCAVLGVNIEVITVSKPFTLPHILAIPGSNDPLLQDNFFIKASGLDDINVMRTSERTLSFRLDSDEKI